MLFAATLYVEDEADERRDAGRRVILRPSTVREGRVEPVDVEIDDLSSTGCGFTADRRLPVGSPIRIGLPGVGAVDARVIRSEGRAHGACFTTSLAPASLARAFAGETVVAFPPAAIAYPPVEPEPVRWPRPVRAAIVLGGSAALWGAILIPFAGWLR